ncbi:hypothetical protein ACHAXT_001499 [Thalassiosira profunda]
MGLLKHVVLPLFVVLDLFSAYLWLVAEDLSDARQVWGRDTPTTDLELHFCHVIGGMALALGINNIAAIVVENAHYRGMAVFLHTLIFSVDGLSYVWLGRDIHPALYVIVPLGLVGLAVHAMEPGIFTKDKTAGKSKSG